MSAPELPLATLERAYARGRLELGLRAAAPALAYAAIATMLRAELTVALVGGVLFALCLVLAHRGGALGRGAARAMLLGALPFAGALVAGLAGHHCGAGTCGAECAPLCAAGGIGAGFLLARDAAQQNAGLGYWLVGLGILGGAATLGCACMGFVGAIAATAGAAIVGLPRVPAMLRA